MKHICKVCGYIYDDNKQSIPFEQLQDNWVCPLCGAAKTDFEAQEESQSESIKPKQPVVIDDNIHKLSVGQLSALCSNLARGCEKQYKSEESKLFTELAEYFTSISPKENNADISEIINTLQEDLQKGYDYINNVAGESKDRGALRVCVWGEKVTRILNTLIQKYKNEGETFFADTEIWVCSVCGFVYTGDIPPELCPVCKVPSWKFEKIERRTD